MEMEKRINSQEQEEDVIDLMEIARLLLHKQVLMSSHSSLMYLKVI